MEPLSSILFRDGTNQLERFSEALGGDFVEIINNAPTDWYRFVQQFATAINYYNSSNEVEGNWTPFFKDIDEEGINDFKKLNSISPHANLMLVFFRLLEYLKKDTNQILEKHRDYFFQDILFFKNRPPVADKTFLVFELSKNVNSFLLKEGTKFKAGKGVDGKEQFFENTRDTVISRSKISNLKNLFVDFENDHRIYAAPFANSLDGLGKPPKDENFAWSTFGESQFGKQLDARNMVEPEIGFAISSPILLLQEGERTVELTLTFSASEQIFSSNQQFTNAFKVYFSGHEQWHEPIMATAELYLKNQTEFTADVDANTGVEQVENRRIDYFNDEIFTQRQIDQINYLTKEVQRQILIERFFYSTGEEKNVGSSAINFINTQLPDLVPDDQLVYKQALHFVINIPREAPPIVSPAADYAGQGISSEFPVVKIVLNNDSSNFIYDRLKNYTLESYQINVESKGTRQLFIQNSQNQVALPGTPVMPFGSNPNVKSRFLIGSYEVFKKNITALNIYLKWKDLPEEDFPTHYSTYNSAAGGGITSNEVFDVQIDLLENNQFPPVTTAAAVPLFTNETNSTNLQRELFLFYENESNLFSGGRAPRLPQFNAFSGKESRGFLRVTLNAPDFQHQKFTRLYTQQVIGKSLAASQAAADAIVLPNEPYTPVLEDIAIDYRASAFINANQNQDVDTFYQIDAFGTKKLNGLTNPPFLPKYDSNGYLFIGLSDFNPPQNLSMLFHFLEGSSSDPGALDETDINWSFLANDTWRKLEPSEILRDTTMGFQQSGVVEIAVPSAISNTNHLLPTYYWIKAEVAENSRAALKLINISSPALEVYRVAPKNEVNNIAAGTITRPENRLSSIKKINQPLNSFGGRLQESNRNLSIRSSERIRHKNRGLDIWGIERLVLEQFPEIFKVKCLPHTRKGADGFEYKAPGNITVITIPDLSNFRAANIFEPRTGTTLLNEVAAFLSTKTSSFVTVHAENPIYDPVTVFANVKFKQGFDAGYYAAQLEEQIKRLLSPWAYKEGEDIVFGGHIFKSKILAFIEKQEYIDYVSDFKLISKVPDDSLYGIDYVNVGEDFIVRPELSTGVGNYVIGNGFIVGAEVVIAAVASEPNAILVSAQQHFIKALRPDDVTCTGTGSLGIGFVQVGESLFVLEDSE